MESFFTEHKDVYFEKQKGLTKFVKKQTLPLLQEEPSFSPVIDFNSSTLQQAEGTGKAVWEALERLVLLSVTLGPQEVYESTKKGERGRRSRRDRVTMLGRTMLS